MTSKDIINILNFLKNSPLDFKVHNTFLMNSAYILNIRWLS